MKFNLSKKPINTMLTGVAGLLLVIILSTSFADSKEVAKETKAIEKVIAKAPSDNGFKVFDRDNNGKISLKEAVKDPALAEQFNTTDENKEALSQRKSMLRKQPQLINNNMF